MTEINPTAEFVADNYKKTLEHIQNIDSKQEIYLNFYKFMSGLGTKYALCPASSKKEFFSAFPGGLAYHNRNVLMWLREFSAMMAPGEFPEESLIKVAFLHNIGKTGTKEEDYYISQKSDWHRKRGMFYEINPKLQFMKIPHRSLFLIQEAKISITEEEYLAILLHDGQYDEFNASYKYKEPKLALVLQNAIQWARKIEKDNKVLWS